jgi:hypothetical protein
MSPLLVAGVGIKHSFLAITLPPVRGFYHPGCPCSLNSRLSLLFMSSGLGVGVGFLVGTFTVVPIAIVFVEVVAVVKVIFRVVVASVGVVVSLVLVLFINALVVLGIGSVVALVVAHGVETLEQPAAAAGGGDGCVVANLSVGVGGSGVVVEVGGGHAKGLLGAGQGVDAGQLEAALLASGGANLGLGVDGAEQLWGKQLAADGAAGPVGQGSLLADEALGVGGDGGEGVDGGLATNAELGVDLGAAVDLARCGGVVD